MIRTEQDVTTAVLAQLSHADDPRLKTIMGLAIQHLHAFVREAQLTEQEFYAACATIAKLGQSTTPSHNEVVLMAGSLGISTLVCLLNNQIAGQATTANLLGPFWRMGSPPTPNGASIVRSPTVGSPLFVTFTVKDVHGTPVAGACVDVWSTSAQGYYENQDPQQADMNLRGQFTTDALGKVWFETIKPSGYPVPVNGVVGDWLRAQGRHNLRPAHVHCLIAKTGYKTQFAQVYDSLDPQLETDSQFGVTAPLVGDYVQHIDEPVPFGTAAQQSAAPREWFALQHTLVVLPGVSALPKAPITGKTADAKPVQTVLQGKHLAR
jgi:hydroxyquinol 1,2-dioxygenase